MTADIAAPVVGIPASTMPTRKLAQAFWRAWNCPQPGRAIGTSARCHFPWQKACRSLRKARFESRSSQGHEIGTQTRSEDGAVDEIDAFPAARTDGNLTVLGTEHAITECHLHK